MSITTEIYRCVWDDKEGAAIRIGPDADSLGLVQITNHDKKSEEYWGIFRLVLDADMAHAVGEALIAAAKDAKEVK